MAVVGEIEASINPDAIVATFLVVLRVDRPLASLGDGFLWWGVSAHRTGIGGHGIVPLSVASRRNCSYILPWVVVEALPAGLLMPSVDSVNEGPRLPD